MIGVLILKDIFLSREGPQTSFLDFFALAKLEVTPQAYFLSLLEIVVIFFNCLNYYIF
jgi:hypothetical protein